MHWVGLKGGVVHPLGGRDGWAGLVGGLGWVVGGWHPAGGGETQGGGPIGGDRRWVGNFHRVPIPHTRGGCLTASYGSICIVYIVTNDHKENINMVLVEIRRVLKQNKNLSFI